MRAVAVAGLSSSKTQLKFAALKRGKKPGGKANFMGKRGNKPCNVIDDPSPLASNRLDLHFFTGDTYQWISWGSQAVRILFDEISVQSAK